MVAEIFPVLDISYITEKYKNTKDWTTDDFMNDPQVINLVQELTINFSEWGFLYVKGHGIPKDVIKSSFSEAKDIFSLPMEEKLKYKRDNGISEGFVPISGESFSDDRPADIKEVFDFIPRCTITENLSKTTSCEHLSDLFHHCNNLVLKLLRLIALALGIDINHFVKYHESIGDRKLNGTSMRMLYYPAIEHETGEEQRRCSEHTDYGTMTLLFQDAVGGLEVLSPSGTFVKAVPIEDTIVINAADLLQTWSNNKFPATIHRVTVPLLQETKARSRQSIAFFTHPDYTVNIAYKDENGEIKKRNAYEHLKQRFQETIKT